MAALNELIQKVENPELRAQLQAAADKLAKQKKFGLVFEEHLPECTPLYDIPVRKGAKVSVRNGKAMQPSLSWDSSTKPRCPWVCNSRSCCPLCG